MLDPRTERLVHIAYWARRYLANHIEGNALNHQHDALVLGRQLTEALDAFVQDVPPLNDRDRAYYSERHSAEVFARR